MIISVQAPVYSTESAEKVHDCLLRLFPDAKFTREEFNGILMIRAESDKRKSIEWMRTRIREIRIIDAVRRRLVSNWNGTETSILLDKQAACSSRFRILDDAEERPPLGCIQVVLKFENEIEFQNTMNWLVPPTENGRIVHP